MPELPDFSVLVDLMEMLKPIMGILKVVTGSLGGAA